MVMEYTANISAAITNQRNWNDINTDSDSSDDVNTGNEGRQISDTSTWRQGREEAQVHNEDPESSNLPPHDVNGDEEHVNAKGPVTTAAPQLVAPVQQAQLVAPVSHKWLDWRRPSMLG